VQEGKVGDRRGVETILRAELERIKHKAGMGFEVNVLYLPGTVKYENGRQLLAECRGNSILIYCNDPDSVEELLRHEFIEWILNQHTRRYRLLINKLIEAIEAIEYEEKERIVDALTRLLDT